MGEDEAGPDVEHLLSAAHANNGEAQYDLGLAYLNGDGVPRDFVEAYFWLTVCSGTEKVFWSPSPDELAAESSLHIRDEASLGEVINRIVLWLAERGPPTAGDY
jgi:Sel1 repeat-containing protein